MDEMADRASGTPCFSPVSDPFVRFGIQVTYSIALTRLNPGTHVQVLPFLPLTLVLNSTLPASYPYYTLEPYPLADLYFSYPPNPALTLCLIPWVRAVYMAARQRLFQAVLGRSATPIASPASPANLLNGQPPVVHLPGEADFARHDIQRDPPRDDFAANLEMLNGNPGDQRRVVVTVASGARILAGSLIFPGAAALTGSILLWLAKRHHSGRGWLAWALGLGISSSAAAPSTIWNLSTFLPPHREYVDPVWWRSTVGGALLVVLKDFWSMTRQAMEIKRAASRRVQSQAVRDGLEI